MMGMKFIRFSVSRGRFTLCDSTHVFRYDVVNLVSPFIIVHICYI